MRTIPVPGDTDDARLMGLACHAVDPGAWPAAVGYHPVVQGMLHLLACCPDQAETCFREFEPHSAIAACLMARVYSVLRHHDQAERLLEMAKDLAIDPFDQDLVHLERVRSFSYRYRFDEALLHLYHMIESPGCHPALRAQAFSSWGDLLSHGRARLEFHSRFLVRRGTGPETGMFEWALSRTEDSVFGEAISLGTQAGCSCIFLLEQHRKRLGHHARRKNWKRVLELAPAMSEFDCLVPFHRSFLDSCTLLARWGCKLQSCSPDEDQRMVRSILEVPPPKHAPGLARTSRVSEQASQKKLIGADEEHEHLSRLLGELDTMDRSPGDLLDWLDRALVADAEQVLHHWVDHCLDPDRDTCRTCGDRLRGVLEESDRMANRHVQELVSDPETRRRLLDALNGTGGANNLDTQVPLAFVPISGLAALFEPGVSVPSFVRLLAGNRRWYCIRAMDGKVLPDVIQIGFEVLDSTGGILDGKRLGKMLFEGFPDGESVAVVADGAAEEIPFHTLEHGIGCWGGKLFLYQAPNLAFLLAPVAPTAIPASKRLPEDVQLINRCDFGGIPAVDRFFSGDRQAGVLHISGHGEHVDPDPHLDEVHLERWKMGVGEVMSLSSGYRLVVLDTCKGGASPAESHENDLGLSMAALLGGAETVLSFRENVGRDPGGFRGRLFEPLYTLLAQGFQPRQALIEFLAGMGQLGRNTGFLRIQGRRPLP